MAHKDEHLHEVISVFDLFKIGIGPSSSHSVGPMIAAQRFLSRHKRKGNLERIARMRVDLFGSLALTGHGHGTDRAVFLGLMGELPESVDTEAAAGRIEAMRQDRRLALLGEHEIDFDMAQDLVFHMEKTLDYHPNGMACVTFDGAGAEIENRTYFSVGGGFVIAEGEIGLEVPRNFSASDLPFTFTTAAELLELGEESGLSIAEMSWRNELTLRPEEEVSDGLARIWQAMTDCIERGCTTEGVLPGGLNVRRRAPDLCRRLRDRPERTFRDPTRVLDWVNLFALAVNEENAAGGRVVTAPTNGAAGIIPAVLTYYDRIHPRADEKGIETFLLTASAIGQLYKRNASISGAEVGCQGEVGVACSMAAAGLAAALGGSNGQIENAAEIGMEHNLGMTCDPVGGLVQIPCIERNAMASVKAINAASLALKGDGTHFVSLDAVIETMRQTGLDMQSKYKETSQGGLAVNVVEC